MSCQAALKLRDLYSWFPKSRLRVSQAPGPHTHHLRKQAPPFTGLRERKWKDPDMNHGNAVHPQPQLPSP
ncbi:hypothetical protein PBY51_015648 [Eleginops maclovinus]|uniref:Uncharacterized protein n=1 Tax=Eleginops maclovinus TaxID=56733 RepID=A0AAN8ARB9_ELEMC|nr:hypothetical protein PBY51_015648 [Eleginops maclovinus]